MKKFRSATGGFVLATLAITPVWGDIVVSLDPAVAEYDSDVKGIVTDQGNGPDSPDNKSGVPAIEDSGENLHSAGFTFNIDFTPLEADLSGTRLLIELGGISNGSGLYLIDGVPTLLSKQNAGATTTPVDLNDTSLNAIAVQSSIGLLEAGSRYSFAASWNHAGTLELHAAPAGETIVSNSFAISGPPGNWSGNDTLSVKDLPVNNAGGLARDTTNGIDPRFNTAEAQVTSFAGEVHRALFWNANDVVGLQLTAPEVKGFSVTRLPTSGKLRFHWNISEGELPNPTTAVIRLAGADEGDPAVHIIDSSELVSFVDLEETAGNFTLVATNETGVGEASSGTEEDTPHSAVVRDSAPLAWYRFNEGEGSGHLVDSAENDVPNNGVIIGSPVGGGTGFIDGAGQFAGTTTILNRAVLNPGEVDQEVPKGFSVETVVRYEPGATTNRIIVAQQDLEGTGRVIIGIQPDGSLYSFLSGATRSTGSFKLPADAWAHVVLVVDPDGGEFRWYVNGRLVSTNAPSAGYTLESSLGGWVIGSAKNLAADHFRGLVDEVAVYRTLLDDPDRDGDRQDSRISDHFHAWHGLTSGILYFGASAQSVNTGSSADLHVLVGADVTSLSIDHGVGALPVEDGYATTSVVPTETTTYTATAEAGAETYSADVTVAYNQLSLPVIYGFEATTLPAAGNVRLHWSATPGDFPTPVEVKLTWGDDLSGLHETTSLSGFHDIPVDEATNLKIELTNYIGSSSAEAEDPAPDTPHSAVIRASEPVAWYRFNEALFSGLVVDSAENEAPHNGTLSNGIAVNTGDRGFIDGAATFNASTGIPTDLIIDPFVLDAGFTIEAIVETNPGNGSVNRVLVSQQGGTGRWLLGIDDTGSVRSNAGASGTAATTRVPPRAWSHVVVVIDAYNNEARYYIDGEFAGSQETDYFEASTEAWVIGSGKGLDGNFWRGKIDDLIIYDKMLDLEDPEGEPDDGVIIAHRDAWWNQTSGVLYAGATPQTIAAGESAELLIKVGADVTAVTISPSVGSVPIDGEIEGKAKGSALVTLTPGSTTEYTITYHSPSGDVTQVVTITVDGAVETATLEVTSTEIADGNFIIRFKGEPSTTYVVKGSETLESFDTDLGTTSTDSAGLGAVSIPIDAGKARQFYRIETEQ